jgi:hypothetical protein
MGGHGTDPYEQNPGRNRVAGIILLVIARLDRAIQYSRGVID